MSGRLIQVSGIVTQGRNEVDEWVSNYMISYSQDASKWEFARDIYGNKKVNIYQVKNLPIKIFDSALALSK